MQQEIYEMKELNHLYNSTIAIHEKKNKVIDNVLKELISKNQQEQNSLEYLDMYFSNIVDLLFSFNSFLINSIPIIRRLELENICKELESIKPFSKDNNNNNLDSLSTCYEKIIKNKNLSIESLLTKKIRIYEVLFRHSSAHGNLGNLINFLLFNELNLICISFNKGSEEQARLRILISKETYENFIKHFEIKEIIDKFIESKIKLYESVTENNIDYIYLTENVSRMFLKWRGHLLFTRPDFSYFLHKNFIEKYKYNVKNIPFSVQLSKDEKLTNNNFFIDYESIKKDINDFIILVIETIKINLIERKIIHIFQNNKSLMCHEIIGKLKFYGINLSEEELKNFILNNIDWLKIENLEKEWDGKILTGIKYIKY